MLSPAATVTVWTSSRHDSEPAAIEHVTLVALLFT
jgi:hypothetical protein